MKVGWCALLAIQCISWHYCHICVHVLTCESLVYSTSNCACSWSAVLLRNVILLKSVFFGKPVRVNQLRINTHY